MNAFALKGKCESTYTISGLLDQKCLEEFLKFLQNDVPDECTRLHIQICSNGGHISIALAIILFCLPAKIGVIIIRLGGTALLIGSAVCIYLEWKHKPLSIEAEILPDDDFEK